MPSINSVEQQQGTPQTATNPINTQTMRNTEFSCLLDSFPPNSLQLWRQWMEWPQPYNLHTVTSQNSPSRHTFWLGVPLSTRFSPTWSAKLIRKFLHPLNRHLVPPGYLTQLHLSLVSPLVRLRTRHTFEVHLSILVRVKEIDNPCH